MSENILQEADRITSKDRRVAYGPVGPDFQRIAELWTAHLREKLTAPITAEDYGVMMILMKTARFSYGKSRDSLVDVAGFARTLELLQEEQTPVKHLLYPEGHPQFTGNLRKPTPILCNTPTAPKTLTEDQFDLAMRPLVKNEPFKQVEPLPSKPVSQTSNYIHRPNPTDQRLKTLHETFVSPIAPSVTRNQLGTVFNAAPRDVLSENRAVHEESARIANIPNVSDSRVPHVSPTDTSYLALAYQAMSLDAPWLDYLRNLGPEYDEAVRKLREDVEPFKRPLQRVHIEETRVKTQALDAEIPGDLRRYASDVDQSKFNNLLAELIGKNRMQLLYNRCAKANMIHTPALWFNQNLFLEISKQLKVPKDGEILYSSPEAVEVEARLKLEVLLGADLFKRLNVACENAGLPIFTTFIAFTDRVLQPPPPPVTSRGIWDGPPPPVLAPTQAKEPKYNQPIKTETGFDKTMTRKEYQLKYNLSPDTGIWKSELLKESP